MYLIFVHLPSNLVIQLFFVPSLISMNINQTSHEELRWISFYLLFSTASFGREVKLSVPCRRFAACKRTVGAYPPFSRP